MPDRPPLRVPVVVLTGHLGAGKTTLLNHLLRHHGVRIGVIVNDFGELGVDAGLVAGQVSDPVAINGGCLCCLEDTDGLDDALRALARPALRLDAIVLEASGLAEPTTLVRLLRASPVPGIRSGGVIDVVDALEHFTTVDTAPEPPLRHAAATLVVLGKTDLVPAEDRARRIARLTERVRARNPRAQVVVADRGRLDPSLVLDPAAEQDAPDQLPLAALLREARAEQEEPEEPTEHAHVHADAVSVPVVAPVDPGRLQDLLEDPPRGVYRMKGRVAVAGPRGRTGAVVHVVGRTVEVTPGPVLEQGELVAIGLHLDTAAVRGALEAATAPASAPDAREHARWMRRRRRGARP